MNYSTIKLTLLHKPFDSISAPLASFPFFSDVRPLHNSAGLVDWRFNGEISHMIEKTRIHGGRGEALMIPTNGRLCSDTLILYGLGKRAAWDPNRAESAFTPWIEKLESLKKNKWLVSFSGLTDDFLAWRQCVRAFVNVLLYQPYSQKDNRPQGGQSRCRHLMLTECPNWILETKKRRMDFGENVDLNFDLSAV